MDDDPTEEDEATVVVVVVVDPTVEDDLGVVPFLNDENLAKSSKCPTFYLDDSTA